MKRLLAFVLTVAALVSCFAVCAAERTDLRKEEIPLAQTEAAGLQKLGILKGTNRGLVLEEALTRAQALTLICRTTGAAFSDLKPVAAPFTDIAGHWAEDTITNFYRAGYVSGVSAQSFAPERTVTGKEFVKILLTVMGYQNVTLDTAYETGISADLLNNNFVKSVVFQNTPLTRSDAVRLCFRALCARTPDGGMLYRKLIEAGTYQEQDFADVLIVTDDPAEPQNFADRLNAQMPTDQNYMFSPMSIRLALALAANGAAGETKRELLRAAAISDLDAFNAASEETMNRYGDLGVLKLDIANSIWLNKSKTAQVFSEPYQAAVSKFYRGEARDTDDKRAVGEINAWVSEHTAGKIPTIIQNNLFQTILINAIYFKGVWQNEFDEYNTRKATFTSRGGKETEIDFMHATTHLGYYGDDTLKIVELPYKNRVDRYSKSGEYLGTDVYDVHLSMFLLMGDGKIENAAALLAEKPLYDKRVRLSLPKFTIEFQTELNTILGNMGLKKAFLDTAEFDPMFDQGSMSLTSILHKTYLAVDEKGTEAAAVTAIVGEGGAIMEEDPVEFFADKPFTFVIRDNDSGEILFMGEYAYAQ